MPVRFTGAGPSDRLSTTTFARKRCCRPVHRAPGNPLYRRKRSFRGALSDKSCRFFSLARECRPEQERSCAMAEIRAQKYLNR